MNLKRIQEILKVKGLNLTQKNIRDILSSLGKKLSDYTTVEAVVAEIVSQSTALSTDDNSKRPSSLALPKEVEEDEIEMNGETTKQRTQSTTSDLNKQVLENAHLMADKNVELAKAFPYLVRNFTAQKYNDALPEIEDSWNSVNQEIFDNLFNIG